MSKKNELLDEFSKIDFNLTKEEQEYLDSCILEEEIKVNLYYKLRTHSLLITIILIISMLPFNVYLIQIPLIILTFSLYSFFDRKHWLSSHILRGMKMPADEFISMTINFIEENYSDEDEIKKDS